MNWGQTSGEIYNDGKWAIQRWVAMMQENTELYRVDGGRPWRLVLDHAGVQQCYDIINKDRVENGLPVVHP